MSRIKRPDIGLANIHFKFNETCDERSKVIIGELLDYIFEIERVLATNGMLTRSVTGFDDCDEQEEENPNACPIEGCRFCREENDG